MFTTVEVVIKLNGCVNQLCFVLFFKGWMEREPCHIYDRAEEPPSNWAHNYWPVLEDRF